MRFAEVVVCSIVFLFAFAFGGAAYIMIDKLVDNYPKVSVTAECVECDFSVPVRIRYSAEGLIVLPHKPVLCPECGDVVEYISKKKG